MRTPGPDPAATAPARQSAADNLGSLRPSWLMCRQVSARLPDQTSVSDQQRTALLSVIAAAVLVALKLTTGLVTGSLGLISEAAHSGTDFVAALLTFFALRVAVRPPDRDHPFGHGKAEHLAALGEASFLTVVSVFLGYQAINRLLEPSQHHVDARWYALAVLGVVILIDASRAATSWRASRRYGSPALASNALHFASDLAGSTAVLAGLILVRAGYPAADSIAALVVAVLVIGAAVRLMGENVSVLMDRTSAEAEDKVRRAIHDAAPELPLTRLRMREAAGRHFADVVMGAPSDAGLAQGHAIADRVERAIQEALPGSDVVVHVEPELVTGSLRERATAAALGVPEVREVHNVKVMELGDRVEVSLHVKLPNDMSLDEAHEVADEVEQAVAGADPRIARVQVHLEPLTESVRGGQLTAGQANALRDAIQAIVKDVTGVDALDIDVHDTDHGPVALITVPMAGSSSLDESHTRAHAIEDIVRAQLPELADVVIHTQPS
jgi:cation diffusion facilitator family transporter